MPNTLTKVIKLEILKPSSGDWKDLGDKLRETQRVTSQALNYCMRNYYVGAAPICEALLANGEKVTKKAINQKTFTAVLGKHYGDKLSSYVYGTLDNIARQRWNTEWYDVLVRGERSLSTYRKDCPIYIRATGVRIWEEEDGDYTNHCLALKLLPRKEKEKRGPEETVILHGNCFKDKSVRTIWNRLLNGEYNLGNVQILYNKRRKKWFANLSYKFEPKITQELDPETRVGVDLGIAVPVYLAVNNGFARAGLFQIGDSINAFRRQIEKRRTILRHNERKLLESRKGHGRKNKLKPINKLQDLVQNYRKDVNHKLSRAVINFALQQNAGVIVMEDLKGYTDQHAEDKFLKGWTYFELQSMIKYKADEAGIRVEIVKPRYTSQRCSKCGYIDPGNRDNRNFKCLECGQTFDADYNAARNIATKDIEKLIEDTRKEKKNLEKNDDTSSQVDLFRQEA